MILKQLLFAGAMLLALPAEAAPSAGLRFIKSDGVIRCGTDLSTNAYTYKDAEGHWEGIDPTLCSIFATAIFGNPNNFEMVNVPTGQADSYLATQKIDVMLGNSDSTASAELTGNALPAATIYHDRLVFLAKATEKPKSMMDFQNQNVCITNRSPDVENFEQYLRNYDLKLSILKFANFASAKASFLLNRCQLLVGQETILTDLKNQYPQRKDIMLLPEEIDVRPVYVLVAKQNPDLQAIIKWIVNALILAEEADINSKNVVILTGDNNISLRNLLGSNPEIWKKLGLQPDWVKKAIKLYGNYGEIFEKNLGSESPLKLQRNRSNLIKNGGMLKSQSFL